MPIFTQTPNPLGLPLFPGQLRIDIGTSGRPGSNRAKPNRVSISLQRYETDGTSKLKSVPEPRSQTPHEWTLLQLAGDPVLLTLTPPRLAKGMTAAFLRDQTYSLTWVLGAQMAHELTGHAAELLGTFTSGTTQLSRLLEFTDPAFYNNVLIGLTERVRGDRVDRQAMLQKLLGLWAHEDIKRRDALTSFAKHRPLQPGPDRDTYDAGFAAFYSLSQRSQAALRRQLAAL